MQVVGFLSGTPVFRLEIHVDVYQRLVRLSEEGVTEIPDWLDFGQSNQRDRRVIFTADPHWFHAYFREEGVFLNEPPR